MAALLTQRLLQQEHGLQQQEEQLCKRKEQLEL